MTTVNNENSEENKNTGIGLDKTYFKSKCPEIDYKKFDNCQICNKS